MTEIEIERRVFRYADYGDVTAYSVRITPTPGSDAVGAAYKAGVPIDAVHLRAAWGQTIVRTPSHTALNAMTEAELAALCESAFFRPLGR